MLTPDVCPVVLTRVSALPPHRMRSVCLPETLRAISEDRGWGESLAKLRNVITDALYQLVPELDNEPQLRRAVLALKRDVHNGRMPSLRADLIEGIAARLGAEAAQALERWLQGVSEQHRVRAHARELFTREVQQASEHLAQAMNDPHLQQGLALSSPDFLQTILRGQRLTKADPGSRSARSALAYMARAAVKLSPFSTFTLLGFTGLLESFEPGPSRMFHASRALATSWLQLCALDRRLAPAFAYEPNPSLRTVDGRWVMLMPEYYYQDGIFYRREEFVDVGAYQHFVEFVLEGRTSNYERYLEIIGGDDPAATFARMVRIHFIRPVAPWSRVERHPLRRLAEVLESRPETHSVETARRIHRIASALEQMADASGPARLQAIHFVRQETAQAYEQAKLHPPHWLMSEPHVFENVGLAEQLPPLGPHVLQDLQRLGEFVRPSFFRTSVYSELVSHFVRRYGPGRECGDLLDFLASFTLAPDFPIKMEECLRKDLASMNQPQTSAAPVPAAASSYPPSLTVWFQIAAGSLADVHNGNYTLVVNQIHSGYGGLLARFTPLMGDSAHAQFATWLDSMCPEADPLEFPLYTEWSSLQHSGIGEHPFLEWPTEWPTTERCPRIALSECSLVHDPETDTLVVLGPDRRPVAPLYRGATPPSLTVGALRLFFVLLDPWLCGYRPGGGWPVPQQPPKGGVEYSARETLGRIVLRRAQWRMPVEEFPRLDKGEDPVAYLRRVDDWRLAHGMPMEVYISQERAGLSLKAKHRKPVWVRFDSYHTLLAAQQLFDASLLGLRVVEALPSMEEHWLLQRDGACRAAEFAVLLRWPQ